jgi:hypothetical protein
MDSPIIVFFNQPPGDTCLMHGLFHEAELPGYQRNTPIDGYLLSRVLKLLTLYGHMTTYGRSGTIFALAKVDPYGMAEFGSRGGFQLHHADELDVPVNFASRFGCTGC